MSMHFPLRWRHNGRDGVSNHQTHYYSLNCLFRRRWTKISQLRVTGLCAGDSPVTGEFPSQMTGNAENAFSWRRHHVQALDINYEMEMTITTVMYPVYQGGCYLLQHRQNQFVIDILNRTLWYFNKTVRFKQRHDTWLLSLYPIRRNCCNDIYGNILLINFTAYCTGRTKLDDVVLVVLLTWMPAFTAFV